MKLAGRFAGLRLGVLAALIGMTLSCGIARAQTIGAGACQTSDGSTACGGDPGLVAVGNGSCVGIDAPCSDDPVLATVGDESCGAGGSGLDNCSDDPVLAAVGDNSCDVDGGSCDNDPVLARVGDDSCMVGDGVEVPATICSAADLVAVGNGSCDSGGGCAGGAIATVGDDSCDNGGLGGSCGGLYGPVSVGDGSCDVDSGGDQAVAFVGPCSSVGAVGSGSCSGGFGYAPVYPSCALDSPRLASVGDDSCNNGCLLNAGLTSVADYSCNGPLSGSGTAAPCSCVGTGDVCTSASGSPVTGSVGVCRYNTVSVSQCDPAAAPSLEAGSAPPRWNGAEVTVEWNWAAGPDGAALPAGSATNCPSSSTSSGEGAITLTATCGDQNGNIGTASYTVEVDADGPTDAPVIIGTLGRNGWYTSMVSVSWNWTDDLSGLVASACTQTGASGSQEGPSVVLSSSCEDNAGSTATGRQSFKIDTVAPSVTLTGARSTYTLLQTVDIACSATDNSGGSGVASGACAAPVADAAAWTFGPGSTTLTATATDNAGNVGSGSARFSVTVTTGPLCTLTTEFVDGSPTYKALRFWQRLPVDAQVRTACSDLRQIGTTSTSHQIAAAIAAYDGQVQALSGTGGLSSSQVSTLAGLAAALLA